MSARRPRACERPSGARAIRSRCRGRRWRRRRRGERLRARAGTGEVSGDGSGEGEAPPTGALVQVHRPIVFGQRAAEGVRAVVAAHEVEVVARRRTQHGANRLDPGRRRSVRAAGPGQLVGVVRRVDREVLLADVAVVAAGLAQRVDDGGVGLQRHRSSEPVQEHRRRCAAVRCRAPSPVSTSDASVTISRKRRPARRDRLALGCDHLAEALHHAHDQRLLAARPT